MQWRIGDWLPSAAPRKSTAKSGDTWTVHVAGETNDLKGGAHRNGERCDWCTIVCGHENPPRLRPTPGRKRTAAEWSWLQNADQGRLSADGWLCATIHANQMKTNWNGSRAHERNCSPNDRSRQSHVM